MLASFADDLVIILRVKNTLRYVNSLFRDKLAEAKELVYLKGFYEGRMLVGEHKGRSVQEAKPLIKQQLLDQGEAVVYMEPEKTIISRWAASPVGRYLPVDLLEPVISTYSVHGGLYWGVLFFA